MSVNAYLLANGLCLMDRLIQNSELSAPESTVVG